MPSKFKILSSLAIPALIIISLIGVMMYIAYKAEVDEGLRVGTANLYIDQDSVKKKAGSPRRDYHPKKEPRSLDKAVDSGKTMNSEEPQEKPVGESGDDYGGEEDYGSDNKGLSEPNFDNNIFQQNEVEPSYAQPSKTAKGPAAKEFGFTAIDDKFTPATKEDTGSQDAEGSTNKSPVIHVKGAALNEMFIFGVYNSMLDGRLYLDGKYSFLPQGSKTRDKVTLDLSLKPIKSRKTSVQLPVILNGEVISSSAVCGDRSVSINSAGELSVKGLMNKTIPVEYAIIRRTENSILSARFNNSEWLEKEFRTIPNDIKSILDAGKTGPEDYKMMLIAAVIGKCFGYQKDIIPVKLASGATWTGMLNDTLKNNKRLLADCDVLSVYSLIFARYMSIKSAVAVGYNNSDPATLETLTQDKHHALLLIRINGKWMIFDPMEITPDMKDAALEIANINEQRQENRSEKDGGGPGFRNDANIEPADLSSFTAKRFQMPANVAQVLGTVIFQKDSADDDPDNGPFNKALLIALSLFFMYISATRILSAADNERIEAAARNKLLVAEKILISLPFILLLTNIFGSYAGAEIPEAASLAGAVLCVFGVLFFIADDIVSRARKTQSKAGSVLYIIMSCGSVIYSWNIAGLVFLILGIVAYLFNNRKILLKF